MNCIFSQTTSFYFAIKNIGTFNIKFWQMRCIKDFLKKPRKQNNFISICSNELVQVGLIVQGLPLDMQHQEEKK